MKSVYVSGSIAFDSLMQTSLSLRGLSFPDAGTATHSILAESIFKNDGGTAGNIAYYLSLFGIQPKLITSVGEDARAYLEKLSSLGADVSLVNIVRELSTAYSSALTDSVGNQIFFFCPGAMSVPAYTRIDTADFAVVAPGNHADMQSLASAYAQKKIPYIFDPGQMIHSLSADILQSAIRGAHTVILNEFEWGELCRKIDTDVEKVLAVAKVLIVTRGEHGASLYTEDLQMQIGAISVTAVDAMGAGDAFRAGYLCGLLAQRTLEESIQLGHTLASFCVESHGTQPERPTIQAISERLLTHYKRDFALYTTAL